MGTWCGFCPVNALTRLIFSQKIITLLNSFFFCLLQVEKERRERGPLFNDRTWFGSSQTLEILRTEMDRVIASQNNGTRRKIG